jgi:hypothetical protein
LSARFVANTRCVVFFVIFPLLLFEDKTTLVQVIRQGGFGWVNVSGCDGADLVEALCISTLLGVRVFLFLLLQ